MRWLHEQVLLGSARVAQGLLLFLVMAAALLASGVDADAAGKRVALVIGNGDYKTAPRLDNPVTDAKAVAGAFKRLGFEVTEGYDLTIADMRKTLADFVVSLADSEAAVVYYAGHGVSVDGENYLLPTDIALKSPADLDLNAISVSLILRQMRREERANVVILDACRNNPFAEALARAKTRAVVGEQGLSRIDGDLARGSLIAFASDPKATALDGRPGEHSPFTKALLDHLEDPNISIETMMSRVRAEVWEATKNQQLPWVNTSLIGELELNPKQTPAEPPPVSVAPSDRQATENLLWESAQRSNLAADYQAYLDAFPKGLFAPMARNRIAALSAPTSPPSPALRSQPDETALRIAINAELNRLGCYAGAAEADWSSPAVRGALANAARRAGLAQTPTAPSGEFLSLLQSRTARLCPLTCGPREIARDGRCVVKTCGAGETMNGRGECMRAIVRPKPAPKPAATRVEAARPMAAPSVDADTSHLCAPGLHVVLRHFRAFTCEPD